MAPEAADIVVVGAGAAGLYAAHLLRTAAPALKTVVLEAGSRAGGRILSLEHFAPWPIDLGGEFIHGEDTLHYNFCRKHGLALQRTFCSFPPTGGREAYFPEDGRPVAEHFWLPTERRLVSWVDAQQPEEAGGVPHLAHMLAELENIEFGVDIAPGAASDLYTYLVGRGVHQSVLSLADSVLAKTWSTDLHMLDAAECAAESAKEHFEPGPNNFIVEGGQKQMLDVMAEGADIRFKSMVTLIEHQGDGSGHVVRTEAGEEYRTARVLVAAPVTAYRPAAEGSFAFSPRIPALETAAAEAFEGWAVKVLLSFTRRFWDPSMLLVFCADSVVSQIWADPPRPTYAEAGDCHVLTGFITGSQAKAASGWSAWEVVDAFLKQLDAMFATQEVPRPASDAKDDHSICNWVTYGDICASYTSPTKGSADRESPLLVSASPEVSEPCRLGGAGMSAFSALHHDGGLACCGEHVGGHAHYEIGTINAAMESAQAAVERWFPDALPAEFRELSSKPRL